MKYIWKHKHDFGPYWSCPVYTYDTQIAPYIHGLDIVYDRLEIFQIELNSN